MPVTASNAARPREDQEGTALAEHLMHAAYRHDVNQAPLAESLAVLDNAYCVVLDGASHEKGIPKVIVARLEGLARRCEALRIAVLLNKPAADLVAQLKGLHTALTGVHLLSARSGRVSPALDLVLRYLSIATQRVLMRVAAETSSTAARPAAH